MEMRPIKWRLKENSQPLTALSLPIVSTVAILWLVYSISLTTAIAIQGSTPQRFLIAPRIVMLFAAIAITLAIYGVLFTLPLRTNRSRVLATLVAGTIGSALHTATNYVVFYRVFRVAWTQRFYFPEHVLAVADWFWAYCAATAVLLALRYGAELSERDVRLARFEAASRTAELRALRYQINPHFLFNSLNSIVALIGQSRGRAAQEMTENLADFLRAGLALDISEDIDLADEVALQRLYLAVEAERFPHRLRFDVDIPDSLRATRVPSLILQPLVENSIKYGVARSPELVTISVGGRRDGEFVKIWVSDDALTPKGEEFQAHGPGIGLRNVRERLAARYGKAAEFLSGPLPERGYRTLLRLPLEEWESDA